MTNSQEHVTCALCGLMVTMDRLRRGPFPPVARTRTWGGSLPKQKGDQRRRGIMDWSEKRDCSRADLLLIKAKLQAALKQVEEELKG
jgi:hypothetical protein